MYAHTLACVVDTNEVMACVMKSVTSSQLERFHVGAYDMRTD